MSVEPMAAPRKPRTTRSHEDIYELIEAASRKADDAVHRTDLLTQVVQRIETKLDGVRSTIGGEGQDERGEPVGTGIVGRLMRLEAKVSRRFSQYDGWVKLVVGFTAAAAIFLPVLWWLMSGRLEAVLK